jgi:hypothetical protein
MLFVFHHLPIRLFLKRTTLFFLLFKNKNMKIFYAVKARFFYLFFLIAVYTSAQVPTTTTNGICDGVIANFNTTDNGYNSPSIYGSIFDSSLYYNSNRGYWTDYLPPLRVNPPGFPRVLNIISPPYNNPNPNGTFNVGFYYIVNNPFIDRFQVRIISVTTTPMGTVTNVEATSGVQFFSTWSTPQLYVDTGTALLNGFSGFVCIRLTDPDIANGPNTTFRVEVSYIINGATFAVFDNVSIGPQTIPLPVSFIGLLANRNTDNSVNLRWDVTEEINVQEYQVERSDNGSYFTSVGSVAPKGKSLYTFTNTNVPSQTVFYRIKSVDIDGRYKYSGIVKLSGNAVNSYSNDMQVYPVPAQDEVTITHKKLSRDAKMILTTADGRIVKNISLVMGSSHTPLTISGLTRGLYFVRLEDENGNVQVTKLLKN